VAGLRLEVRDFVDLTRWRWTLTDSNGAFIADHEVRLNEADWQYEAFTDLLGYLSWHAAPDRKRQDEARITGELGAWIGEQVLGPIAAHLAARCPVTVSVAFPDAARELAFRPLELAHVNEKPLAAQDVTLVMEPPAAPAGQSAPVGDRLRVLGLFSLPEGGQPLNLRRERQALVTLIGGIDATGRAADVRVLQYGATRDRLQDALEEAEGWDVIHVSGHGAPGELLLETADGSPDHITATDLADLLDLARARVKLVTVSACWSAAVTTADQRRLLGLPTPHLAPDTKRLRTTQPDPGALATELASRLGCAVLAMRYPVDDEFAIALSQKLYDLLARQGQPLPRAVGITLRQLARDHPALAVATPALFGGRAVDVKLAAPKRTGARSYATDSGDLKLAGFPPPPDRFVGRVGVMTRASAALAAKRGIPGVLLHGMPGGGKTACALELAYGHEHAFDRLIWYKAPDDGMTIDGALTDFAQTLERYLEGFQMAHTCVSAETLTAFLPRLTELMERRRLLIVIDNAESLLTDSGAWRDDRWGQVTGALTAHRGLGRVIVTSRRLPSIPDRVQVEAVDVLSAGESLLLVRELPNLQALGRGEVSGIDRMDARRLSRRAVEAAQGHPKLLELAEGQAAHPDRLAALIEVSDQAWKKRQGSLPPGFFAEGEATASAATATAADYWHILADWTESVADMLAPGERDLFWLLCCLEEPDRQRLVLDANWADLWRRLGRDGGPPSLDQALAAVAAAGLAAIRPGAKDADGTYALHPGVAEAGRSHAGQPFQDAVDIEAADYWAAVYEQASSLTNDGSVHTTLLVRAGLAAVPYLLRQQQWQHVAYLLEAAFARDPSRANAAAMLPAITQVTRHDPAQADLLALVLQVFDPAAAEAVLRQALDAAVAAGDYRAASGMAGRLADQCRNSGRLAEALALTEQQIGYTRRADLGPWTQLLDEVQRLQVLTAMGHARHVLAQVTRLRAHMATLPATPGTDEMVTAWNVREMLLGTGRVAALRLRRWAEALDLNAAIAVSQRDRDAPATDTAATRFHDYAPLLRLGRIEEALGVLRDCLRAFQDADDTQMLSMTLGALADVEDKRGHGEAALRLQRDALRHSYLAGDVDGITVSYHNLGNYLRRHTGQPAQALASHLAAALSCILIGVDDDDESASAAAADLRAVGTAAVPPTSVADLDRQLGGIPGTDLPALLATISPDPETTEQALRDLIAKAQELAAAPPAEASPDA
jgi:tetratricopeptide (TPR) repeat protein